MIQFNLLPDVKLQYIKAEQTRRLVIAVSMCVSIAALGCLLLLISLNALQTKHLHDLNADIKKASSTIQKQPDLNKVLTIQNQLSSLTKLHSGKPAASRLTTYLNQITPAKATINNLIATFTTQTVTITGTADALSTVNQYVDTIKFTSYQTADGTTKKAFPSVVLTAFGLTAHESTYTIAFTYEPDIFDITQSITLTVPKQVTTRSQIDQPGALFALPIDSVPATGKAR